MCGVCGSPYNRSKIMSLSVRVLLPEPVHVPLLDVGEVVGAKVGVGGGGGEEVLLRLGGAEAVAVRLVDRAERARDGGAVGDVDRWPARSAGQLCFELAI